MIGATACGGDDREAEPGPSTATSAGGVRPAGDQEPAESAVLNIKDLPAGWVESGPPDNDDAVADCPELSAIESRSTGVASSGFRSSTGEAAIVSTVTLWQNEVEANEYLDAWQQVATSDCAKEMIRRHTLAALEMNPDLRNPEVRSVDLAVLPARQAGHRAIALRATTQVSAGDVQGAFVGDYEVVRVGRATAGFEFGDVGAPLGDPRDDAIRAVLARLPD